MWRINIVRNDLDTWWQNHHHTPRSQALCTKWVFVSVHNCLIVFNCFVISGYFLKTLGGLSILFLSLNFESGNRKQSWRFSNSPAPAEIMRSWHPQPGRYQSVWQRWWDAWCTVLISKVSVMLERNHCLREFHSRPGSLGLWAYRVDRQVLCAESQLEKAPQKNVTEIKDKCSSNGGKITHILLFPQVFFSKIIIKFNGYKICSQLMRLIKETNSQIFF